MRSGDLCPALPKLKGMLALDGGYSSATPPSLWKRERERRRNVGDSLPLSLSHSPPFPPPLRKLDLTDQILTEFRSSSTSPLRRCGLPLSTVDDDGLLYLLLPA